jgi:hypothetical protein
MPLGRRRRSDGDAMKRLLTLLAAPGIGVVVLYGVVGVPCLWPWPKTGGDVVSGLGTEILVMRTPGGLLEVSRITATEQFDKKCVYTVLGRKVGETVAYIRVPAVFRYHIELAPEWEVYRTGTCSRSLPRL